MRRIVGYDTFPHNEGEMPVIKMIGAYGFTEHDAYCVSITDYGSGGFLRLPDEKEARRWFKEIARYKKNLFKTSQYANNMHGLHSCTLLWKRLPLYRL